MSGTKDKSVTSDDELSAMEKETTINCPNDTETCRITTEVPTVIKWVQSVEESEIEWTRQVNDEIVAVSATIPKGLLKLQGNARKSNQHSDMVSYGPLIDQ